MPAGEPRTAEQDSEESEQPSKKRMFLRVPLVDSTLKVRPPGQKSEDPNVELLKFKDTYNRTMTQEIASQIASLVAEDPSRVKELGLEARQRLLKGECSRLSFLLFLFWRFAV